jgi:hypothetical protein
VSGSGEQEERARRLEEGIKALSADEVEQCVVAAIVGVAEFALELERLGLVAEDESLEVARAMRPYALAGVQYVREERERGEASFENWRREALNWREALYRAEAWQEVVDRMGLGREVTERVIEPVWVAAYAPTLVTVVDADALHVGGHERSGGSEAVRGGREE